MTIAVHRTRARPVAAPPAGLERVAVVILNWREPQLTLRAARSILADGVPADRLVVVDNGSGDGSAELLREALPGSTVLALPRNLSLSRAFNAGARALEADAYVLCNNDASVQRPGSMRALLRALDDPRVGMVVPRVLNWDLTVQRVAMPLNTPASTLVRASGASRLLPDGLQPRLGSRWRHDRSREIFCAELPVVLVRGATWRVLGGLDERIERFGEEQDVCRRCRRAGWRVWFTAEAEFVHLGSSAGADPATRAERAYQTGRAEAAVMREHLSPPAAALSCAFWSAGLRARAALYRAAGHGETAAELRSLARGCASGWRLPHG